MNPQRPHMDKDGLLKNYLTGDITRQDERRLEAMAEADPFLAEAMEGFGALPENEHAESVTKLKARLRHRASGRRRGAGFFLLRAAAFGAVLLAGWAIFQQFNPNMEGAISAVKKETAPAPKIEEPSFEPAAETAETTSDVTQKAEGGEAEIPNPMAEIAQVKKPGKEAVKRKKETPKKAAETGLATADKKDKTGNEAAKKMNGESGFAQTKAADEVAPIVEEEVLVESSPPPADDFGDGAMPPMDEEKRAGNAAPMVHKIVGKVTNDFGDPLGGASVVDELTNTGTVTDRNGYFAIETAAPKPNLRISYLGYEEKNLSVSHDDFVDVKLAENDIATDEVTVTSMKKMKASPLPPHPEGGFAKLERYIRKNLRRPGSEGEVKGEVRLLFSIGADGTPTDFEILDSLGDAFDEEAKRLLREGPKWERGTDEKVRYSVKF